MTNLTLNFNLSDDEALRPWLAEFGSWQEDGGLVVDARTFQKKGANGDDYYVGGKFVVMGSISDTEKGGFEMVGAKDKTKSVCSWRESVMRFLGGLKHFVNAHSMLRRDPMSGIHGPLSEEDNFFLQTLLGHPRFQDPLDQQILHRLIRTHGPKAVLGFLDGFLGRVPGTAYENHLSRSHASAVREENGKWVLDTNLSFSAWGYRKAFLHGADVLLAAHPLVSAMLAPGEDIAVFEKIVFRGIMREQLRLVASTERPEKSQLEIRLVTTAGRRIFLAGSSNGRPVDPIVKLKNNPMALKDETGLCRRMIKEGKLDRHVDGTVSFSFPLAAVPADLQQSLLSALEHDRTGAQFLLLSTALDTVMKAMHHITLSEFSYEGMLRMVAGVADADFPSWQALTNGSLDLQLRFKTTGPSRKTENMQFLRVPIELVTRQTGKVVGSMTVIFAGTNQASIANRSLAPKSPDSSKDSGGRGIASPKGDVALHSTEDQIEEDPIDEAPVDDEAQDEPVNQAFDDFFWPLFEAGRGAGLIADDAIRFLRGQTGLSKGKQLARCLYFLNRLNRRPPGSGVGEILDDVEKFTRRLERETQVSKERGLPTIGGKIGGERGLFDKNLFEFLRTFHCGIDGEIIVADNEQSHSTYMLMLPAAGSLFEAQAVVHLLIQAGVLKDGLFRYQITLSGPLTEEAKYIALALHSHQALKPPFSPIVTSDVGFKTLAPIVDGGGAFDDIHQTGGQGVDARYDIPFLSLVSVHDGLALIAKCLESPRAKAGPLERRVLDLIDRVPAWLEKMGMIRIEGTKWPQEVADKAMSGLARVIEKEFGGQHRRAMEAATYLTWAMQGPPGSRRVEIYARFMMGMKAVYSVYRLGDVLDAQWIGKKWDEIYPGLKQVDEATETSNGFDEIVGKLVDEVVAELRILCDTGLDLPSGVSPSHTEDGVFEDEDPIGDEAPFDEAPADEITYRRVVPRWKAADTDTLAEIFARNNNDLSARNVARQVVPVAERAGLAPSQMLAVFDSIAAHIPPHEQSAAIMVLLPVAFTAAWEVELTPAQIVDLFRLIAEQSRSARAFKKLPEAIVQAWEAGFSADQIVDFIGRLTTKHGTESGDAYERFGLAVRRASDAGSSGKRIFDAMVKRFKVDIDLPPENVNLEQDVPELEKGMPHRLHYDQLKALLSSPEIMPLFFKTLWEKSHTYPLPEQPETLVLVGLKSGAWRDSVVSGLRLLTGAEAKKYDKGKWFRLAFEWNEGKRFIRELNGNGVLELGLAFLTGQISRKIENPVEKFLLAGMWGTQAHGRDASEKLTWKQLTAYLREEKTDPIKKLWTLLRHANPTLPEQPETLVLLGTKQESERDFAVSGLRLLTGAEAKKYDKGDWFRLAFEWNEGKRFIRELNGNGALDMGLAFLTGQISQKIENPVEKFLLAGMWGARIQSKDPSEQLDWERLTAYLAQGKTNPIGDLWGLLRLANPHLPKKPETLVLVGVKRGAEKDCSVSGLRLLTGEEAKKYDKEGWFRLTFEWIAEKPFIQKLGGRGALELGFAFFEARVGRVIESPVEKALLAGMWGVPNKYEDTSEQLTSERLTAYLARGETDLIGNLWELLRLANPHLPEQPETLVLVGLKSGAWRDSVVSGLRLLTGAEAKKYDKEGWFRLTFEWIAGKYVLQNHKGRGTTELVDALRNGGHGWEEDGDFEDPGDEAPFDEAQGEPVDESPLPAPISLEGRVLYGEEAQRFLDNAAWFLDQKLGHLVGPGLTTAVDAVKKGQPLPAWFLLNTGGTDFEFDSFITGRPGKKMFPFVYQPVGNYRQQVARSLYTYYLDRTGRGRTGRQLTMEIYLPLNDFLEFLTTPPELPVLGNFDYVGIKKEMIEYFREFIRTRQIPMRVLAPVEFKDSGHVQNISQSGRAHVHFLSPRNRKMGEAFQATQWAREAYTALESQDNSAPISGLPAWEPMLLEQLSPQAEVISGIAEEDGESGEESMTDTETITVDIPSGTASDSLWLWPQTTGPIMAFSGAPMLARSARVLVLR